MKNIINIHIQSKDDYKNKYNQNILSYQLSNYILEEAKGINVKEKIKFNITSDFDMKIQERNDLIDMIRNNFGADIGEIINQSKKTTISKYIIVTYILYLNYIIINYQYPNISTIHFNSRMDITR